MAARKLSPPEVEGCLVLGHWEGSLIKGKSNSSVVEGFSAALNRMPRAMRKSMTYDSEQLDAIALQLNMRPRKRFDFKCPIEGMDEVMQKNLANAA